MKSTKMERLFSKRTADFGAVISTISNLVCEVRFHASPKTGLSMISMDPANVAMVIVNFKPDFFTKFEWDGKFTTNLSHLKEIFKEKKYDSFEMRKVDNKLEIQFYGKDRSPSFKLPFIELEDKDAKLPKLTFLYEVTMPTKFMKDIVKDVERVSMGSVRFSGTKNDIAFSSEGDLSDYNETLYKSAAIEIKAQQTARTLYSTEYLKNMVVIKGNLFKKIKMSFSTDYPLMVDYAINGLTLQYILAPRVDND
jgi:proliferating cell nuclear antigen PCNA